MGDRFMEGTAAAAMRKALKAERGAGGSGKAVLILLACLFRRQEMAGTATALVLFQSPSTVYDWLARMHRGGLNALRDQAKPGRPPKIDSNLYGDISDMIDKQPAACGILSNVWTGRLIIIMLSMKFGIGKVSPSAVCRMMRKMNKSWKLPSRPFDRRTPSDDAKGQFKAELGQKIVEAASKGLRVFCIDEANFTTKTKLGRTWPARGLSVVCKIKPYGKWRACFAALGAGGVIHHRHYDRGNTEYMIDFVRSIREKYGKALLVMDNTSYHKSRALVKEIEAYGGDIRLECPPAYSPDLNPVEMVWKELKSTSPTAYTSG